MNWAELRLHCCEEAFWEYNESSGSSSDYASIIEDDVYNDREYHSYFFDDGAEHDYFNDSEGEHDYF